MRAGRKEFGARAGSGYSGPRTEFGTIFPICRWSVNSKWRSKRISAMASCRIIPSLVAPILARLTLRPNTLESSQTRVIHSQIDRMEKSFRNVPVLPTRETNRSSLLFLYIISVASRRVPLRDATSAFTTSYRRKPRPPWRSNWRHRCRKVGQNSRRSAARRS